jgi:hypothetical protein
MTRSDHEIRDIRDDYRGYATLGWKQLLCAWFIVLTFAMVFKITDFISAHRTAPFARTADLSRMADIERADEIEQWERGEPRQWTMTLPNSREVLVSRVDK